MKRETQTGFSRLSFFAGRGPSMATSFSVFCRDTLPLFGAIVVVVVVVLDDLALWQSYCGDETSSSLKTSLERDHVHGRPGNRRLYSCRLLLFSSF